MTRDAPLSSLSGIGPEIAAQFAALGIVNAYDLLAHLPFRYEDLREPTLSSALRTLDPETEVNALGTVVSVRERRARIAIIEATLRDEAGEFNAVWFGRKYMFGKMSEGMRVFVRGRLERKGGRQAPIAASLQIPKINVSTHRVFNEGEKYEGEIVPVYRATKDLPTRRIRQILAKNLPRLLMMPLDELPADIERRHHFSDARSAFSQVHHPTTPEIAKTAHERLSFGEFFALALAAALKRARRMREAGAQVIAIPDDLFAQFTGALPFAPTGAQRRVIDEIWRDMAAPSPMNRLLQGDVGSGKTLVAAAAILAAARAGLQSALMAPTEILAAQHASKLAPLLLPLGVRVEAVFGSQGARARAQAVGRIASGEADLAVGTHALLTDNVEFKRLALAIIDEQHRFGVAHRAKLRG